MKPRRSQVKAFLMLLVLVSGLTAVVSWSFLLLEAKDPELKVVFLDVGQGDAIFIQAPNGSQVLIDGGLTSDVLRELSKVMPFWDRTIDLVVATHPHADHIGGLIDVFERFEVAHILETAIKEDTPVVKAYERAVKNESAEQVPRERGTKIILDSNVVLTILSREVVAASDPNDASIVLRLDYGETSFLFTGDATKFVEEELLQFYKALDIDVLKVGHHGSNTSTSSAFVSATSPDIAVISVGANNSYGHPTQNVLETLAAQSVEVLRTDELGTIQLVSDGRNISEKRLGFLAELFGI